MAEKLKIAQYWGAGCGGCDTATLDVHERIVDIANLADILFWPIAVDGKYADVEAMEDGHIDVCLYNGAIRTSENHHLAQLLRKKSKVLVAFGSCAHIGGIPGLANMWDKKSIFERVYITTDSTVNPDRVFPQTSVDVPEGTLTIPEFYDTVYTLDQVVDVDYYVPGCPPPYDTIFEILVTVATAVLHGGELPPKGSILGALDIAECDECPREKKHTTITEFKRIATAMPDPNVCFLEQGFLCMGPATRGGCGSRCQNSGVSCRGCYGPTPNVRDQGAKMLSALASNLESKDPEEIERILSMVPDPVRTFYRFGLPASILRRRSL